MSESSRWSAEVPWQEGTDKDFADFQNEMERAKQKRTKDESSSSSEEEQQKDEALEKFKDYNKFIDTESEEEDDPVEDPDPGATKPKKRILWAAQYNKLNLVKEMLKAKPGLVGARDEDLYTPLHRASYNGHVQMVRLLLQSGADPLATTDTGWTPLHSASKWNNVDCMEVLLNAGVPVNTVSEGGLTPLHVAAMSVSCREAIELLLMQPEVDLLLTSNQGDTAREIAGRNGPLAPLFDAGEPRSIEKYRELR